MSDEALNTEQIQLNDKSSIKPTEQANDKSPNKRTVRIDDNITTDSPQNETQPLGAEEGEAPPLKNCFRLVLAGSSRVGKTSIVSRFLDNRYEDRYTPTIENFHRKVYTIRGESYRLDILDTSGNNPFPAMRRLSLMTGDLFILVYSIDNRESFEEVKRLQSQIFELKSYKPGVAGAGPSPAVSHCSVGGTSSWRKKKPYVPMVIAGNKCELNPVSPINRVVETWELLKLAENRSSCGCVESSARKNINIEEMFLKLFMLAQLPTEMTPSLHRKITPSYVVTSSPRGSRRRMTLRRRLSDACGAVTVDVRRPSIRTDMMMIKSKQELRLTQETGDNVRLHRETKACCLQ